MDFLLAWIGGNIGLVVKFTSRGYNRLWIPVSSKTGNPNQ